MSVCYCREYRTSDQSHKHHSGATGDGVCGKLAARRRHELSHGPCPAWVPHGDTDTNADSNARSTLPQENVTNGVTAGPTLGLLRLRPWGSMPSASPRHPLTIPALAGPVWFVPRVGRDSRCHDLPIRAPLQQKQEQCRKKDISQGQSDGHGFSPLRAEPLARIPRPRILIHLRYAVSNTARRGN